MIIYIYNNNVPKVYVYKVLMVQKTMQLYISLRAPFINT